MVWGNFDSHERILQLSEETGGELRAIQAILRIRMVNAIKSSLLFIKEIYERDEVFYTFIMNRTLKYTLVSYHRNLMT